MANEIEQFKQFQARALEELREEIVKRDKLNEELSALEKEKIVNHFLNVRFRYGSSNSRVSILQGQLGLWTHCLIEAEKKAGST